jgi:hypothetical protein
MTRKQALIELRDKVKAGYVDFDWGFAASPSRIALPNQWHDAMNAYLGSLDAAKALHEAVLPGWTVEKLCEWHRDGQSVGWGAVLRQHVDPPATISAGLFGTNPARAWLLAILEALISQEPDT